MDYHWQTTTELTKMRATQTTSRGRGPMVVGLILAWAVVMVAFMSWMMASHMVPLPEPAAGGGTVTLSSQAAVALSPTNTHSPVTGEWRMIHILVAGCPCSRYTAQCLCARKPAPDCQETVFILGGSADWEADLAPAGFTIRHKDGDELVRETGIAGGPWLLIISPAGQIVYSGGYAAQRPRPGVALNDLALFQRLRAHEAAKAYPAFGCAATPLVQGIFDSVAVCQSIK
jgi:hypothetical protein